MSHTTVASAQLDKGLLHFAGHIDTRRKVHVLHKLKDDVALRAVWIKAIVRQSGRKELARGIADGFSRYYEKFVRATSTQRRKQQETTESASDEESTAQQSSTTTSESGEYYRIQIASSRQPLKTSDPYFRNVSDVQREQRGKLYLYTAEQCSSLSEARQELVL